MNLRNHGLDGISQLCKAKAFRRREDAASRDESRVFGSRGDFDVAVAQWTKAGQPRNAVRFQRRAGLDNKVDFDSTGVARIDADFLDSTDSHAPVSHCRP